MKIIRIKVQYLFFVFLGMSMSCNSYKVEFFVSTDGNDSYPGTYYEPFKSIEKAKESVRALLIEDPGKSVTVNIKEGIYYLDKTVEFSFEDSGSENAPIIYKAVKGTKPIFTGSVELKNWSLLEDTEVLKILPPDVCGKIYITDVKVDGINNLGDPTEIGKHPELFCNGEMQTLARWPNEGFVYAGLAMGKTEIEPTYSKHGTKEGVLEYLNNRQNQWVLENDPRLGGYWYWDWLDEFQKIEKIDTLSNIFYLCEPFHIYGYGDSLRYYGLNLFCEMDHPGEWYLDRAKGLLYWYPPEGIIPNNEQVTLSVFDEPFMFEIENCSNIILEGLTFQEGRGSAIRIRHGNSCLISDCRIRRFGKDGIHIHGGEAHGISGCLVQNMGCRGIDLKGGDRKTLTSANHFVENTVVSDFSLFKRTYEPAVHVEGCGIRINHNTFKNSSSSAMRLEGNDITIEYNDISHVVNESDDQGGVDMYFNPSYRGVIIKNNRWSNIKGGTHCGAAGIRLDDMISGVIISGNVFEYCGALDFGAIQIHGGKDNLVEHNLFYNCETAVSFSRWSEELWSKTLEAPVMKKKLYEDVDIRSELYQKRYMELKDLHTGLNVNTIKNNLLVDCDNLFKREGGENISENNLSIQSDGKTVEKLCSSEILTKFGIPAIPINQIGPQNNRWIE